jgi:hypothetical protein
MFRVDTFDLFGRRIKGVVPRTRKNARDMAHFIRGEVINKGRATAIGGTHGVITDVRVVPFDS